MLRQRIASQMEQPARTHARSQRPERVFTEFPHRTRSGTWSRKRRLAAKAWQLEGKENPRFVVTNLSRRQWLTRPLYEELYCERGETENRVKEQLPLLAIRVRQQQEHLLHADSQPA